MDHDRSAFGHVWVTLWLPEAGGPIDLDDPAHRALLMMLGAQSRPRRAHRRRTVPSDSAIKSRPKGGTPSLSWFK